MTLVGPGLCCVGIKTLLGFTHHGCIGLFPRLQRDLAQAVGAGNQLAVYEQASDGRAVARASLVLPTDGANSINTDGMVLSADQRALTVIHKFALAHGSVSYRGTGSVDGHLGWDPQRKSYRLSEHNGDLRVLSFTGSFGWFNLQDAQTVAPSPAKLTALRERSSDQTLQAVASLPNAARPAHIGKTGEQVYAVRFLGDRAYVVTFRRTDPLYVLDLSKPTDPKTVGELEVAGFSDYLFPLPNNLLLGVGRDANSNGLVNGLKVALPVTLASTPYANWQHGLQKFEVDTSARTLRAVGLAGPVVNTAQASLWLERSVQMGDTLYYLNNGALTGYGW